MEIPNKIKTHILKAAKHYKIAVESTDVIRSWLEEVNLNNDSVLDPLIDMVEMGTGNGEDFISYLESTDPEEGNDEDYSYE